MHLFLWKYFLQSPVDNHLHVDFSVNTVALWCYQNICSTNDVSLGWGYHFEHPMADWVSVTFIFVILLNATEITHFTFFHLFDFYFLL